jgi:hypothetical protein
MGREMMRTVVIVLIVLVVVVVLFWILFGAVHFESGGSTSPMPV